MTCPLDHQPDTRVPRKLDGSLHVRVLRGVDGVRRIPIPRAGPTGIRRAGGVVVVAGHGVLGVPVGGGKKRVIVPGSP